MSERTRMRLKCANQDLDGIIVEVLEKLPALLVDGEQVVLHYYRVSTGVGSGEYRALAAELEPLMHLNGNAQEVCPVCGSSNVVRTGKCATCMNCGEPTGCS